MVATPELSLDPVTWCFPVTGCIAYRGYFDPEDAVEFGQALADRGLDVALIRASAYSTLGWFEDPLVSTLLFSADYRVAGTIFHELAHQRVYVAGDSTFNESYAVAVEREGVRRWLATTGDRAMLAAWETEASGTQDFLDLVLGTRAELDALYRSTRAMTPSGPASSASTRTCRPAIAAFAPAGAAMPATTTGSPATSTTRISR